MTEESKIGPKEQKVVLDALDIQMETSPEQVEISAAQIEQIKKDTLKRLKKTRVLEGGVRLVREKSSMQW